jgi:meso-butanediol dehydrogenase / (S,S)-butanediol dehydrogenase / diacetyl reductase
MRLDGKVAIVSGGGTGIGAATARRFTEEGAHVVVTGRRPGPIEAVAAEIGGIAVAGDAADPSHARASVEAAERSFGGLDVVIANAGAGFGGTAADVDDETWERTLAVNLSGPLRLVRAAVPSLRARGAGSIVLMSSVSALVGATGSAAYTASKAALLGLTRSLAVDYGPRGIRTNAVCPGWVETPMADEDMDELATSHGITRDEAYSMATARVPLRRPAKPVEIAACCLFLASDESSIVNGAILVADGGATAVDVGSLAFDEDAP